MRYYKFEEIENHMSHFAVISAHAMFLFLLLPIALLSGCEGHNFDGLIQQTNIHSVGSKAKMSSLLKDAADNSDFRTNGWGVGMEGDVATSEDAESDPRDYVDTNEQVEGVKEGEKETCRPWEGCEGHGREIKEG